MTELIFAINLAFQALFVPLAAPPADPAPTEVSTLHLHGHR